MTERQRVSRMSVCEVRTPTSLVKAYFSRMGIDSPPTLTVPRGAGLSRDDVLGAGMSAFYPGTAQCLIRRTPVRGLLCDIRSEYPTVAALMRLWQWWTAQCVGVEDATADIRDLLSHATSDQFLSPDLWQDLAALCLVQPTGDWLPIRLTIPGANNEGETVLDAPLTTPPHLGPIWFSLADCLISTCRTGRPPRIVRAIRFRPKGRRRGLRPVLFGGATPLLPDRDLFIQLVELRHQLEQVGHHHVAQASKIMANACAFGVAAELHHAAGRKVTVYDGMNRFRTMAETYEEPGPYYCPPLAALATGGGRLLLFLLENLVHQAEGECAMLTIDCAFVTGREPQLILRTGAEGA
jgi:hypothetical protein